MNDPGDTPSERGTWAGVWVTVRGPGAPAAVAPLHLTASPVLLGRSRQAHVRLPDGAVSAAHARLVWRGDAHFLEDLGSVNGTWVGEVRLPPGTLHACVGGEPVRIGPFEVVLAFTPPPSGAAEGGGTEALALELLRGLLGSGAAGGAAPRLELTRPDGAVIVQPLPLERRVVIGRGPSADLQVEDPELSREHVAVTSTLAGIVLDDLGSKNGVHVNGRRVVGRGRLEPGDRVALGGTVALVVDPAAVLLEAMDGEAPAEARAPAALAAPTGTTPAPATPVERATALPRSAPVRRARSAGLLVLAAVGALVVALAALALVRLFG